MFNVIEYVKAVKVKQDIINIKNLYILDTEELSSTYNKHINLCSVVVLPLLIIEVYSKNSLSHSIC